MELNKAHWNKSDILPFQNNLKSLSQGEQKSEWEKRIINTTLPCLAIPAPTVKKIVNEIKKGNYIEFLDLWIWQYYTNTSIIGSLICQIKDFPLMVKYLDKYGDYCDNWATCDTLKFKITAENKPLYFDLCKQYIKSEKPFKRRIGMTILFKLVDDDNFIDQIFDILNTFYDEFYDEKEYYVNMVNAWLVAECFTKQREKTLEFFKNNKLNNFTINKAISKCRDSFRISTADKELLLQFKK
ncbi:MAG: DNA alkylation repair protein [Clostridia bacterium]|nr:DNA alkylation repair protein [Clostridia bacterium]